MSISKLSSVEELDDLLSEPTESVVKTLREIPGDIILLGVGGKMGPTLARMIVRAAELSNTPRRVIGVSRFSDGSLVEQLNSWGIETIAGDLLDEEFVASLPDVPNVIAMTGMKFGATGNEGLTWAMNAYLPALICKKFSQSRIAAFSTGNVYGLVPVEGMGSLEEDIPAPVGEYAMSALGRERMYEYFCTKDNIPTSLIRLNYATELRYGVLVDLAQQIYNDQAIDISMSYVNVIWQGDANAMAICSLRDAASPAFKINVSGPEILNTRDVCERLASTMERQVRFVGNESTEALLNNGSKGHAMYGKPRVSIEEMIPLICDWICNERPMLGKPTHFESVSGKF